jgi:integrase
MARNRGAITKVAVEQLQPDAVLWDGKLSGFGARRRAGGPATYFLYYRFGRGRAARQRWISIGRHGSPWTPDTARQEAEKLLAMVRSPAKAVDPAMQRDVERKAATMAALAIEFEIAHANKWRPSTVRTNAALIARVIVPAFGARRPNDVTHADVARWHVGLADTPGAANRALAILSSMFGWAIKNHLRDAANPCRDVKRYRGRKIERHLSAAELARLGEALKAVEAREPYTVAALRLLIFTGARLGEILGLRWDWIDLEAGLIRLPDSKTGAKPIYLNAPAREVLANFSRVAGNPHVIVGAREGAALVNLEKPWRRIRDAAGIADVRLHDLRHSFASVGAGMGEGLPIIGRLLGHHSAATTARYAHLSSDPIRAANEKIGARIIAAMTATEPAAVTRLRPFAKG